MSGAPLFSFRSARIEAPGVGLLSPALTFQTDAARVVLVGGWEPLLALLTGRAALGGGHAEVLGERPDRAVFDNHLALALREPSLPGEPTAHEHLTASAALLGLGQRAAAREADRALETLGLLSLRKTRIATLHEIDRRLLRLAHAVLGGPRAVLVERPFEALDDPSAERLAVALEKAGTGRRLVVVLGAPGGTGPEQRFVSRAGHAVVCGGGVVVAEGEPGEIFGPSLRCVVWVTRHAAALEEALTSRGLSVARVAGSGAEDARLIVEVGRDGSAGGADVIVEAAAATAAPVLELSPLGLSLRAARPS